MTSMTFFVLFFFFFVFCFLFDFFLPTSSAEFASDAGGGVADASPMAEDDVLSRFFLEAGFAFVHLASPFSFPRRPCITRAMLSSTSALLLASLCTTAPFEESGDLEPKSTTSPASNDTRSIPTSEESRDSAGNFPGWSESPSFVLHSDGIFLPSLAAACSQRLRLVNSFIRFVRSLSVTSAYVAMRLSHSLDDLASSPGPFPGSIAPISSPNAPPLPPSLLSAGALSLSITTASRPSRIRSVRTLAAHASATVMKGRK
mmetsp:Transcript_6556/g.14862  ORF Transcript_6556/g.14862 Transcript_6556/m.14862 type:complete len:259 (-) Transcript_6556:188-964(-)